MRKLFELTSKDWMSGIAISSQYPSSGVFSDAAGINPFLFPFTTGSEMGLLRPAPIALFSSGVVDDIWGGVNDGSQFKSYFIGDEGHFYDGNSSSDLSTLTDLRSGTPITSPAEGVTIYQVPGGTRYLYYAREAYIGRWDLSGSYPTGWTDAFAGSGGSGFSIALQTTTIRNFHHFVGNVYFTDKNYIGGIIDDDGGIGVEPSIQSQLLDLPSNMTAVDIDDDGFYLVIAATENVISGNTFINTINKIYFWDTAANSWQREWTIVTPYISSIHKIGSVMYALCTDGLYAFTFNTPPKLIVPLTAADGPAQTGGVFPTSQLATVDKDVLYWAASTHVGAFGSPVPSLSPRYYKPFKTINASDTVPTYLNSVGKFYFATAGQNPTGTEKFGILKNLESGTAETGVSAKTVYLPLGQKFNILKMEIILGEPLASGDDLNIDVKSDEDTSVSDWGTVSYSAFGAKRTVMLTNRFTAENLQLIINFNGGKVKVKKINVYGEPVTI